ncbi:AAA family ATPase [Caenimonas terrae]|uniref:AAA family ATPase n=1 Tax=Caenimonas terrae TaxID=696074 RepID=A0ABW0NDP6_9BURK
MLTRLRLKGFKNLIDCEVRFGPFTCVAGPNGAGKSNLFDAIAFLSDLATYPIIEAAHRVRRTGRTSGSLVELFAATPEGTAREMLLEADFLVPKVVRDDFDREAVPSSTFLTYIVGLRFLSETTGSERIEIFKEELTYVPKSDAKRRLGFLTSRAFLDSVLGGSKRSEYISTEVRDGGDSVILLRQDRVQGPPSRVPARSTPRTVLSTVNTEDKPTALAARREMQNWAQLQLEPSKLRQPDDFDAPSRLDSDGAHLPATLHRLGRYDAVANTLANLLPDVGGIRVDLDESRRSKTLYLKTRFGGEYPARSLSDGTLRFLALSVLAADETSMGVICMEEPENGIHPARIPAIVELLKGIAVDTSVPVGEGNPLRQVIVNTHSPRVVTALAVEELIVATLVRVGSATATTFGSLEGTWRASLTTEGIKAPPVTRGMLIDYLETVSSVATMNETEVGSETIGEWAQQPLEFLE